MTNHDVKNVTQKFQPIPPTRTSTNWDIISSIYRASDITPYGHWVCYWSPTHSKQYHMLKNVCHNTRHISLITLVPLNRSYNPPTGQNMLFHKRMQKKKKYSIFIFKSVGRNYLAHLIMYVHFVATSAIFYLICDITTKEEECFIQYWVAWVIQRKSKRVSE